MEPVSAVFGIMAALPQLVQSAKELYDLRSRYKDASVLISAIYSESMVIAASLSQIQNLLQHDALQQKPQLLETFDRALTGCRVVYGCLEEEVRDLRIKAANNDLKFKDRAEFLWKGATFRELLTQIRGQQSALSLLIQGLQMESIADIRKLVEENSMTLEQVVKRSNTLRQSHPRIRVPDSLFRHQNPAQDAIDAESIVKATDFSFDDQVINSKAYRRAMALYTSHLETKAGHVAETEIASDDKTACGTLQDDIVAQKKADQSQHSSQKIDNPVVAVPMAEPGSNVSPANDTTDPFEAIEKDVLPFMPRITSTAPHLSSLSTENINGTRSSTREGASQLLFRSFSEANISAPVDDVPPLLPRRPSGEFVQPARSMSSDESTDASFSPSALSKASTFSSFTTYAPSEYSSIISRKPVRKPLPLKHQISQDLLNTVSSPRTTSTPSTPATPATHFENAEMHNVWKALVNAEQKQVDRLLKFPKMFYYNVVQQWPILQPHLGAILIMEKLVLLNVELLRAFEKSLAGGDTAVCDCLLFEDYANKAYTVLREYCQQMPHARSSLRATTARYPRFTPFVNTLGLSIAWFGKSWEDYLMAPISQLDVYGEHLQQLSGISRKLVDAAACHEAKRLGRAMDAIQQLRLLATTTTEDAQGREDIQNLEKRLHILNPDVLSQLKLLDSARRVNFQGGMAIKLKGQGPWQNVHVMLLDNYLVWGKLKTMKKERTDSIVVVDAPIAITDLTVDAPCDQHQHQKATMFDELPRGTLIYTININNRSKEKKPHILGAFGFQERKEWQAQLEAAVSAQALCET